MSSRWVHANGGGRGLALGLLLVSLAPVLAETPTAPGRLNSNIDADSAKPWLTQMRADVEFLASEKLRGRSVADETIEEAARYVAERMAQSGLLTDWIDGTPFQPVTVTLGAEVGAAANNRIKFRNRENDEQMVADFPEAMSPLAIGSGSGRVKGRLVFVGYGITSPKLNYDDYAAVDVTGATVIVIRKEPQAADPQSPFDGVKNTRHALFATKIQNAIQHGAAAMILVNDPASVLQSLQDVRNQIKRERDRKTSIEVQLQKLPTNAVNSRKQLEDRMENVDAMVQSLQSDLAKTQRGVLGVSDAGRKPAELDSIPVVSVDRNLISRWLEQSHAKTLEQLEAAIDQKTAPSSFELSGVTVDLQVELKPTVAQTSNVVGILPGRGPLSEQTIVVGAHYDHVGMGGYGSLAPGTVAVHNGADDNASGTATMLAVGGRTVQSLANVQSHRRVVFIAFTGEERGLIGSKFYTEHPLFPLANTAAMVNLDMVGRLRDNELTVYGTGSADNLDATLEKSNEGPKLNLYKVPTGYGPSDHQSFYEAGVPVLFFFTGLHNDYHRPTDDFDKINFGGMSRVTDIVSEVTLALATDPQRPNYAETENRFRIRRQMTAFIGVSLSTNGDHVVLSAVHAGGPAERGGLRVGDRLEIIAGQEIRTTNDVLEMMRTRSPGQQLKIRVSRSGKVIETTIRLDPRPEG